MTFALPAESSEFLRRLGNKSRADRNGISIVRGTIGHRSIEVIHTGVGENICRERIGKFLENQQFDFLISAGFAGSLNHQLQVNDLLVAQNFSTVDLKHASLSNVSIYAANMLTVPAVIDSSEERERIARESGASAVDMETEFIARACAAHGIPLLSLRVITDTPTQPFPAPPSVLFDIQQQRTHIAVLARFFLAHPRRIPGLVQFARRIARARKTLRMRLRRLQGLKKVAAIDPVSQAVVPARLPARGYSFAGSMCTSTSATRESLCWIAAFTRCAISWPSCTEMLPSTPTWKIDVEVEAHLSGATFFHLDDTRDRTGDGAEWI